MIGTSKCHQRSPPPLWHETYCYGETFHFTSLFHAIANGILSNLRGNEFIKVSRAEYEQQMIWVLWSYQMNKYCPVVCNVLAYILCVRNEIVLQEKSIITCLWSNTQMLTQYIHYDILSIIRTCLTFKPSECHVFHHCINILMICDLQGRLVPVCPARVHWKILICLGVLGETHNPLLWVKKEKYFVR